jgi:two-component system response regulator MprA
MQVRETYEFNRRRGERRYRGAQRLEDCAVLCAQPDGALRGIVLQALEGVRVVPAATGLEALGAMDVSFFNVYILDYWLPDWSGLGLCRHIRKRDRFGPICFFSNANEPECMTRAAGCGADVYLAATHDPAELRRGVEDALKFRVARLNAMIGC